MFTPGKSKSSIATYKDDYSRGVYSSHSPKPNLSSSNFTDAHSSQSRRGPSQGREPPKSGSTVKTNYSSPAQYKSKRPVEINDIIETDKPANISTSTPGYESQVFSNYDSPVSHDVISNKTPFSHGRGISNRGDNQLSDGDLEPNNSSFRTTPQTQKASNTASYLAEKVYSMKFKSPTILGSLLPLSKSRTPTNVQLTMSAKNATNTDKSILRDIDDSRGELRTPQKSEVSMRGEPLPKDRNASNANLLSQNKSTYSQKSLGKLLNDGKTASWVPSNQLKRDNSWSKLKTKPTVSETKKGASEQPKKKSATVIGSPNMSGIKDRRRSKPSLSIVIKKMDDFVDKIEGACYRITQRNQRIVFVLLLEMLHQHKLKLTKYLEQKGTSLKAKYFEQWQRYMIDVYTERQRIEQEKADATKFELAGSFHDRKLLRKYFSILQDVKKEAPVRKMPSKSDNPERIRSARNLHQNNPLPIKTLTPQSTKASSSGKINTLQNAPGRTRISQPKKSTQDRSFVSPQKKSITSKLDTNDKRSLSVGKGTIGLASPKGSKTACPSRALSPTGTIIIKPSLAVNVAPTQKVLEIPRFGKSAVYLSSPIEVEEAKERSRSPNKPNNDNDHEHSFGCKNNSQDFGKGGEMFDSVLNDILHTSANMQDQELYPTLKSITQDGMKTSENILVLVHEESTRKEAPKTAARKNNHTTKITSPAKTSRDRYTSSPLKSSTSIRSTVLSNRGNLEVKTKTEESKKSNNNNNNNKDRTVRPPSITSPTAAEFAENEREIQNTEKAMVFLNRKLNKKYVYRLFTALKNRTKGNIEKAIKHRKRVLMQNAFIWLLAVSAQAKDEIDEKDIRAEHHYRNNLKIKGVSGLLENYVKGFKQDQLAQSHYENKVFNSCFSGWVAALPELSEEKEINEAAYSEIVNRFRFIVLAEKAIREWKNTVMNNKKKKVVVPPKKKYGAR